MTTPSPPLCNTTEASHYLGVHRARIKWAASSLKIQIKLHPTKRGHFFDVEDMVRLAAALEVDFDPESLRVA